MSSVALVPSTPPILKRPLASVWLPRRVPRTVTCAFSSGIWFRSSTTPEIVLPCAEAEVTGADSRAASKISHRISFGKVLVLLVARCRARKMKYECPSILNSSSVSERGESRRSLGRGKKRMTVHCQWQGKKEPRSWRASGYLSVPTRSNRNGREDYCRVVIAITPPIFPVPNLVVASHDR